MPLEISSDHVFSLKYSLTCLNPRMSFTRNSTEAFFPYKFPVLSLVAQFWYLELIVPLALTRYTQISIAPKKVIHQVHEWSGFPLHWLVDESYPYYSVKMLMFNIMLLALIKDSCSVRSPAFSISIASLLHRCVLNTWATWNSTYIEAAFSYRVANKKSQISIGRWKAYNNPRLPYEEGSG